MGLHLEAPVSWRSSAYDKHSRRDSSHPSTFSPLHALKAKRTSWRLERSKSNVVVKTRSVESNATTDSTDQGRVPALESILFRLPRHVRETIYGFVVNPTGSKTLHMLLKYQPRPKMPVLRFRACRMGNGGAEFDPKRKCKGYFNTMTGSYHGSFDSILNLILVSRDVCDEVLGLLYGRYEFDFDDERAVKMFREGMSEENRARMKDSKCSY